MRMESQRQFDLIVVGGGIVGAAAFLKLQRRHPQARIALLEKEAILSDHQTGHNSRVIHSGLYYPPGSLKGRRERRACSLMASRACVVRT